MEKSPFVDKMYDLRVLVLVETNPQSDEYEQIHLTRPQFIKLLRYIETIACDVDGDDIYMEVVDDDTIKIPNRNSYA